MVGVTSIQIKESLPELIEQLPQAKTSTAQQRLQVLYWLQQENPPTIETIAQSLGKHRNTVQRWLSKYRNGGLESMLKIKQSPGRVRVIPQWAENALAKRLESPEEGFTSYGQVQQWLQEKLGVEAKYHAVDQMTRYRLKAKLKVPCPQYKKQNQKQREAKKKTLGTTCN